MTEGVTNPPFSELYIVRLIQKEGNKPMEKGGVNRYWTPEQELIWEARIRAARSFAQTHIAMLLRDVMKYDWRSKESRRPKAQARLRIALASDADLKELAELEVSIEETNPGWIPGLDRALRVTERFGELKEQRAKIKEEGIKSIYLEVANAS